jgi:nitrogen regulatory protein PII
MSFKSLAVAFILFLSLLLSAGALALSAFSVQGNTNDRPDDAPVRISGIGNSGNTFYVSPARRSARLANEMNVSAKVSDEQLEQTVRALVARAHQGDADAAAFVFELAAAQRAKVPRQAAPAAN